MAQTRPRFGGGRIMENNAYNKNPSLPMHSERETENRTSMDASFYNQSCEPKVLAKEKEATGKKKTESETSRTSKGRNDIAPSSQCESQSSSEKEVRYFQLAEESFIDDNSNRRENSPCGDDKSTAHAFRLTRSLMQNDPESVNRDCENKGYIPEESSGHGTKADVKRLMSVFQSLGIHVVIKPYARLSAQPSTDEMVAEEDGMAKNKFSKHVRPIDMSTTPFLKKRLDKKTSKHEEKQGDSNFLYCKNLFLKDRQNHYYLVIAEESAIVDFKILKKQLNAARNLSFADATATETILGEKSGGINPFVAMRESAHEVRFALHQSLLEAKNSRSLLAFHPLDSGLQVEITVHELVAFLEHFDKQLKILPIDLSTSGPYECLPSNADQGMEVNDTSTGYKERKSKARVGSANDDDSKTSNPNQENKLLNPTVNGKPLWKVHMRKGKLKSFLKVTNDNSIMADTKANQPCAAIEKINEKEPEIRGEASTPNPLITNHQTEENKCDGAFYRHESPKESKRFIDEIQQANHQRDLPETAFSSFLPEITQFYNNLSDLNIEFHDLHLRMSTTRDIGPSIGCKCFFLKDRRQNYHLVITHEYYELDHGRLKKALKPKKKLDHAEPADILENLGVQPSRITPFSCTTDRAIANNVMVFMTEKIRPPEVILCIQHPFSEGRRLVMKSGELQRYLSTFRSSIGKVEEKAWPEKFNRIFTRFTDHSCQQNLASQAGQPTFEQQQMHMITNGSTGVAFKRAIMQTGFLDENQDINTLSKTDENRASALKASVPALWNACKRLGEALLFQAGIDTRLMSSSWAEKVDVSSNDETLRGSSVDPPAKDTHKERNDNNILCSSPEENLFTKTEDEKVIWAKESTTGVESCTTEYDHDLALTEYELTRLCSKPYQDRLSDMRPSLTVEDILQHLRNIAVDFTYADGSELDEISRYRERNDVSTCIGQENLTMKLGTDAEDLSCKMPSEKFHDDENKRDDHDNVEICSTAYIYDDNTHYIIVGGESDYLTKRRLRRLFHLPGPLCMGEVDTPGLKPTPFSLALKLKEMSVNKNPKPNIFVILFTSIYLDPETKCVFHLDHKDSSLKLTSSQFENFISKTGMECWYVP